MQQKVVESAPSNPIINPITPPLTPLKIEKPKPKKQGLIFSMDLGQNNGPFLLKDININNSKSVKLLNNAELKKVAKQASNVLEGPNDSKLDYSIMNRVFEDWEGLIEAKLGIKRTTIFKLTDPSKEEINENEEKKQDLIYGNEENIEENNEIIEKSSEKEKNKEKKEEKKKKCMDLENVEEKYRSKLSNIENLTTELQFHTESISHLQGDLKYLKSIIIELRAEIANLGVLIESLNSETLKKQLIPFIRDFYMKNVKNLMKEEETEEFKLKKEVSRLVLEKSHLLREIDWAEKKIKKNEKFIGVYIYRHTNDL